MIPAIDEATEPAPKSPGCYYYCGHEGPLVHIGIASAGDPVAFSHAWHCSGCGRPTFTLCRDLTPASRSKTAPQPPA